MRLYDKPVSKHFYDEVLRMYPILRENESYLRMFFHLSFPANIYRDENSGLILVSESILAMIERKEHDLVVSHRYNGGKFLQDFKRDVLPNFDWSGYSKSDGKSRAVVHSGFSQGYQQLLDAEKSNVWKFDKRVYFLSGQAYNRANREAQKALQRRDAFEMMKLTENQDALMIGSYLNDLPSNAFTNIVNRNLEAAIEVAKSMIYKPKRKMKESERRLIETRNRERNLEVLATIEAQAQPFYKPVENTVRLFTITDSIAQLSTPVREALTNGWVEVDLKSSQLAITATLWGATDVVEFLQRGGNIWREMFLYYEIEPNVDIKKAFKDALYALLFGANETEVQRHLTKRLKALGVKSGGSLFMKHWIIESMVAARNKEIDRITTLGGDYTIYGSWLPLADNLTKGSISNRYYDVKSILAQQAQAVEMKIIATLFRLAANTDDFAITLYQFDGVSILFKMKHRQDEYIQRMKESVESIAKSLGIHTTLEVKGM